MHSPCSLWSITCIATDSKHNALPAPSVWRLPSHGWCSLDNPTRLSAYRWSSSDRDGRKANSQRQENCLDMLPYNTGPYGPHPTEDCWMSTESSWRCLVVSPAVSLCPAFQFSHSSPRFCLCRSNLLSQPNSTYRKDELCYYLGSAWFKTFHVFASPFAFCLCQREVALLLLTVSSNTVPLMLCLPPPQDRYWQVSFSPGPLHCFFHLGLK